MKRIWLYCLVALALACDIVGIVISIVYSQYFVMGCLLACALLIVWIFVGCICCDAKAEEFDKAFSAKDYACAQKISDKLTKQSSFFRFYRLNALLIRISCSLVFDRMDEAERLIDVVRHNAGTGWQYRTAYYHILVLLDKEDYETAKAEFADFRAQNANVALYREQIEALDGIFNRLFGNQTQPLPESAINSPFPVVQRIVGKYFEREAITLEEEWN